MKQDGFDFTQLRAIHLIASELARPGDLEKALRRTLATLSDILAMKRGMVTIWRRDVQELHMLVAIGMKTSEAVKYKLGEGIVGTVVETGRPMAIPRLDQEPRFLDRSGARRNLDRSEIAFLCVPIRFGEEVVGTLSVDRAAEGEGDLEEELRLLESVAELIASRVDRRRVFEENTRLRESVSGSGTHGIILGSSEAIRQVRYLVAQVADTKSTVLITGETGTGKGLVARAIHASSPRKDAPFIRVNCGAIPENLIESELFGHEKGAFTGATQARTGRFESAKGGTIFLDEVGELPPQAQVKLLRVLQEREFERVGGSRTHKADARVIAATNRDLEREVEAGRFRADLYYRLNVFPVHVPPLRERGADTLMLADHFTRVYADEMDKRVGRIDTPAIDMLVAYHWPGNVRELENAIERAVVLADGGVISAHMLPPTLQIKAMENRTERRGNLERLVAAYEMELIVDALKDAGGNQTKAADLLGTTKRVIQYKVMRYGIDYLKFRRGQGGG
jgi:Nif-specific regulatory protein